MDTHRHTAAAAAAELLSEDLHVWPAQTGWSSVEATFQVRSDENENDSAVQACD